MKRHILFLTVALPVLLLDQLTKHLIQGWLRLWESKPIIPGLLSISHVRNRGAAFGILKGFTWFLIPVSILAIVFIFAYYKAYKDNTTMRIALGLLLGGALGNLIDRIRLGYVVDFIDFRWWPSFNVADTSVFIGALLLLYCLGYKSPRENRSIAEEDGNGV